MNVKVGKLFISRDKDIGIVEIVGYLPKFDIFVAVPAKRYEGENIDIEYLHEDLLFYRSNGRSLHSDELDLVEEIDGARDLGQ